ncbi:MAG: hypothetical protein HYZ15_05565 [Sphingobacteriales bacterium]|nr:hypothetical protein [Sphingobacteriales bacterium]
MKNYNELTEQERKMLEEQFLLDPDPFYKKEEMDQLRTALKRTAKERFLVMTSLMKMNTMFSNARIVPGGAYPNKTS